MGSQLLSRVAWAGSLLAQTTASGSLGKPVVQATALVFRPVLCGSCPNGWLSPIMLLPSVGLHTSDVLERARQSTRLRKRKIAVENKKKKEERLRKNPPPLPKKIQLMLIAKGLGGDPRPWRTPDTKPFPQDNVWDEFWFTWPRLTVSQALECLREHYHPTMLNNPDGLVWAKLEFNLAGVKKERYMEQFNKMVPIYHPFERGVAEKVILVFAQNPDAQKAAKDAGAVKVGGLDLVEDIAKGKIDITDFDHFLAHDDIAGDLKPLLGILREKFPKKTLGTVGNDIHRLVKTFANGQLVQVKKPKSTLGYIDDPTYGYCEVQVGRLNMPDDEVAGNLTTLLQTLKENEPRRTGGFITRCELYVEGLLEKKFSICHDLVDDTKWKEHVKTREKQMTAAN